MIGTYYGVITMVVIGILAIACWLAAWNFQLPVAVRKSFVLLGGVLMLFIVCIVAVDRTTG